MKSFPLPNVSDVLFNQARCTQVSQSSGIDGIGNFGRICPSSQESMNTVFSFYLFHHYLHYHQHFNFIPQSLLYWIHPRHLWLMLSLAVCPLIQMALTTGKFNRGNSVSVGRRSKTWFLARLRVSSKLDVGLMICCLLSIDDPWRLMLELYELKILK